MSSKQIETVLYKGRRVPVSKYLEDERQSLRSEIELFQRQFGRLENALSKLLCAILGARDSKIPYAIYFSVIGFDARVRLVDNALIEAISENSKLRFLQNERCWPFLLKKIRSIRMLRNDIAHGSLENLIVGNRPYVRWLPPPSDVIRILRRVAKRQIPGISAEEVLRRRSIVSPVIECIDDVTSVVHASRGDNPALPDRWRELRTHLRAAHRLNSNNQSQT